MRHIGLFIPCYIDQFYPRVGMATVRVLERYGVKPVYPRNQTCCGQPMANAGCAKDAAPLADQFLRIFSQFDAVVCPSGSCVSMVRNHYDQFLAGKPGFEELKRKTYELCEFLVDVLKVQSKGRFPHQVGIHQSCHGLRELGLGSSSELRITPYNKVKALLEPLEGIRLVEPDRSDECCGFGGSFAVTEEAVSCMMGRDRIAQFERAQAQVVTAADMSCLMHMEGLIRREKKTIRVMHVSEVLLESGG